MSHKIINNFASPLEALKYVLNNDYMTEFMNSLTYHKDNYTIGEITDRVFSKKNNGFMLKSASYKLKLNITDDDVLTALNNELYVSAFISRHDDDYAVHFLCHQYPQSMKEKFDEQIFDEVVHYMIYKTVLALRLNSKEKMDAYLGI